MTDQHTPGESAETRIIRLDDFLKRNGWVGTGGQAKVLIQAGEVTVNGIVETRRRKQLAIGDVVALWDQTQTVVPEEPLDGS